MSPLTARPLAAAALALALPLTAAPAQAAPPTALIEGVLTAAGGAPAADGDYDLTFRVYGAPGDAAAVWTEGPVKVAILGGRFQHVLGGKVALDWASKPLASPTLGVQVGSEPELPRRPLHSAPYALHAQSAAGLACTGCVSASQLADGGVAAAKVGFAYAASASKGGPALDLACTGCVGSAELAFDGDVDLGGNSLKAKNASFAGDLVAKSVTAVSFLGDGSKLTGIKTPAGSCAKAGEVVKGIAADGALICVPALDAKALPADGLATVSNGLLSNQFVDTIAGADSDLAIPDNTGSEAVSTLTFPDIGLAQTFEVQLEVSNTDLSTVAITLLPPDDKKTGWTVCDPCGDKDAKSLKKTLSVSAPPQKGDLAAWIGANPKGLWTLKVKDTSYCIKQMQGNAALCDPDGKTDGVLVGWSIALQTLSNQKVAAKGMLQATGGLMLPIADKPPFACGAATLGALYYDHKARLLHVCNGVEFDLVETLPGGIGSKGKPGKSCKDIKSQDPGAKSGVAWIDPDGSGPGGKYPVYCEMGEAGGGWVLVMQAQSGHSATFGYGSSHWTTPSTTTDTPPTELSSTNAKYVTFNSFTTTDGQLMVRDKATGKTAVLAVPGLAGQTLLNRFQSLGGAAAYNQSSGVALTLVSGAASPQELMGYPAPTAMCGQMPAKWRINMLSSHSGVRLGNDVASNDQTKNNPSTWVCYDNKTNLSYSGVGGTLESDRAWQDSYGSEALNRWRDSGGKGQGSQHGVELFVR
jgi:hypothetical protein